MKQTNNYITTMSLLSSNTISSDKRARTNYQVVRGIIRRWILIVFLSALYQVTIYAATFVYVTDNVANTVSVIDTASHAVVITIPVGQFPEGVAIRPDGAFAYVANARSNTVSIISTINNRVVATVPVGSVPRSIAFRPDGAFAYVSNFGSNSISVINTSTNTVVATLPAGGGPLKLKSLTLTPDGNFAYVLTSGSVSVIDTMSNSVITTIPVNATDLAIAANNGDFVYVSVPGELFGTGFIYVISNQTHTVVNIINSGPIDRLAITPDGALLYGNEIADLGDAGVSVFDTATLTFVGGVHFDSSPTDLIMTSDGASLLISFGSSIQVVSTATNTVVGTLPLPFGGSVRFTPDGAFAFVSNVFSHQVSIIKLDSNTVIATVPLSPPLSTFPSFTPDGAFAFVAPFASSFAIVRVANNEFVVFDVPAGVDSAALTPDIPWGYQDVSTMTAVSKSSFSQILFPQLFVQFVSVRNNTAQPIAGPITLTVNNLQNAVPVGNTLRSTMLAGADNVLSPGESVIFTLYFFKTLPGNITYTERVLSGTPPN
jgi:YVTN family beta-propeller protein